MIGLQVGLDDECRIRMFVSMHECAHLSFRSREDVPIAITEGGVFCHECTAKVRTGKCQLISTDSRKRVRGILCIHPQPVEDHRCVGPFPVARLTDILHHHAKIREVTPRRHIRERIREISSALCVGELTLHGSLSEEFPTTVMICTHDEPVMHVSGKCSASRDRELESGGEERLSIESRTETKPDKSHEVARGPLSHTRGDRVRVIRHRRGGREVDIGRRSGSARRLLESGRGGVRSNRLSLRGLRHILSQDECGATENRFCNPGTE